MIAGFFLINIYIKTARIYKSRLILASIITTIVVLLLNFVINTKFEITICSITASNVQIKITININISGNFQR